MLIQRAALKPDGVALIHGAAGGVGLAAVEIAKLAGAPVIATASTAEKLAVAKSKGADHLIDYSKGSFVDEVRKAHWRCRRRCNLRPLGGEVTRESLRAIAWVGRLLVIGFTSGAIADLAANRILIKACSVIGVRAGERRSATRL